MKPLPGFAGAEDVRAVEAAPLETWLRGETIPQVLAASAGDFTDEPAYRFYADERLETVAVEESFASLHAKVRAAAALMRSLGVGRTDVVAYLLPGLPQTIEICWGAAEAGIVMPINPFLEPATIAAMLQRVGARVLCIEGPSGTEGTFEKLDAIVALAPCIRHVLVVGEAAASGRAIHYESARDGFAGAVPSAAELPGPGDIAAYFHTGGTTGAPKVAPLTHFNLAAMAFLASYGAGIRRGDRMPCGMPLFHVGGLVMGSLAPFASGACVVQMTRRGYRSPGLLDWFWPFVEREKAAILVGPPTVVIGATQVFQDHMNLGSVRSWVSSAAALPAETHRRFSERTGIPVKEAWGLTEATLVLTFTPPDGASKPGAVGLRLPYCDLAIAAIGADGRPEFLPQGQAGAIVARSPCVFPGYLDAEANGGVLLADGWLNTGDLGCFDEDGYLVISGRAKDMIIRGGHNIDPKVIEEALLAHGGVAMAAAVGLPDRRVGEVPIAFVAPRPGALLDPPELLRSVAAGIEERAAVPKQIVVLEALPLTSVGKVNKQALRLEAGRMAAAAALGLEPAQLRVGDRPGGRVAVSVAPGVALPRSSEAQALLNELGLDFEASMNEEA
ncbi:AMP-binding protein [Nitratireductor pacificus]|uniref:AMP-binding domain protein n=1 Tax=Nitratireductor pacificus pht-3B TaxID=391937 RepID=K2LT85_9HYPH|nr:AMP-binding protein [Nitratireductor pacificus]EKF20999.1 AMP-binding domain protein [Nitratireductor pacificus pht-3B]